MTRFKKQVRIILIGFSLLLFGFDTVLAVDVSEVKNGDEVILMRPMDDGITYYVRTPTGIEIWRDRDLYYFAGIEEKCTVLKSLGSEVLLYVPIMNARYWFTVEKVGVKEIELVE